LIRSITRSRPSYNIVVTECQIDVEHSESLSHVLHAPWNQTSIPHVWLPLVAISDQGVSGDASTWRNFRLFMRRPSIVPLFVSGKPEFHPQQLAHICVEPVLQIAQAGDGPTPAHSARSLEVRQQIWRQKQAAYHNPCLQHHEAEWFLFAKFQVPYAHS